MGEVLGDIGGWFGRVGDELGRVSLGALLVVLALQTVQTGLNALSWLVAVGSISTLVALTPGGIGTQQALAAVALADVASSARVTAYSLGQQAILTAWNAALGIVAMSVTIGWGATSGLVRERWAEDRARRRRG